MNDFFKGLSYAHFRRAISTASNRDIKKVVTELGLGTSSSDKNIMRLYKAVGAGAKEETVDYLVNSIFVRKLPGGGLELNKKYKDIFTGFLDHFKIAHEEGFIGEELEKQAVKRLKKIKPGHIKKYLSGRLVPENRFEHYLVFRFFATHWKLALFEDIIEADDPAAAPGRD